VSFEQVVSSSKVVTGAGGFDNRFRISRDKLLLFFCGRFYRQEITGSGKIKSMDGISSLVTITDVF
jgi:hypothetical protein